MSDQLMFSALNASETLVTGPQSLQDWREKHRVKVPGYQFTPQFKWKKWDGSWAPGKYCRQNPDGSWEFRCSRGLLRRLMNDFGIGVDFQVARVAEIQAFLATRPEFTQLRDFQVRVFHKVLAEGWGRVAFATNAGKGAVVGELAAFGDWRKDPVLILCDEIAVFDALLGEVRKWGRLNPTLVRSGSNHVPTGGVTLAMVQTLARRISKNDPKNQQWKDWLKSVRMLLLDEADKSTADSWKKILAECKNTDWRAGFSGSFGSTLYEQLQFDEIMGPEVDQIRNMDLVERGISARPLIQVYGFDVTPAVGTLPLEWWDMEPTQRRQLTYTRAITHNVERHAFIASRVLRPDAQTVIIVDKIEHGLSLTASIPDAVFLDGSASEGERVDTLDRFTAGDIKTIVVTKILDRGSNRLGHATDIIFASAEGSMTQVLQRIGRGLRRGGGKEEVRVADIMDRIRFQSTDKKMKNAAAFLNAAAKRRLEVYAEEGFEVQLIPYGR